MALHEKVTLVGLVTDAGETDKVGVLNRRGAAQVASVWPVPEPTHVQEALPP